MCNVHGFLSSHGKFLLFRCDRQILATAETAIIVRWQFLLLLRGNVLGVCGMFKLFGAANIIHVFCVASNISMIFMNFDCILALVSFACRPFFLLALWILLINIIYIKSIEFREFNAGNLLQSFYCCEKYNLFTVSLPFLSSFPHEFYLFLTNSSSLRFFFSIFYAFPGRFSSFVGYLLRKPGFFLIYL